LEKTVINNASTGDISVIKTAHLEVYSLIVNKNWQPWKSWWKTVGTKYTVRTHVLIRFWRWHCSFSPHNMRKRLGKVTIKTQPEYNERMALIAVKHFRITHSHIQDKVLASKFLHERSSSFDLNRTHEYQPQNVDSLLKLRSSYDERIWMITSMIHKGNLSALYFAAFYYVSLCFLQPQQCNLQTNVCKKLSLTRNAKFSPR